MYPSHKKNHFSLLYLIFFILLSFGKGGKLTIVYFDENKNYTNMSYLSYSSYIFFSFFFYFLVTLWSNIRIAGKNKMICCAKKEENKKQHENHDTNFIRSAWACHEFIKIKELFQKHSKDNNVTFFIFITSIILKLKNNTAHCENI